jgi:hypothetical protein
MKDPDQRKDQSLSSSFQNPLVSRVRVRVRVGDRARVRFDEGLRLEEGAKPFIFLSKFSGELGLGLGIGPGWYNNLEMVFKLFILPFSPT